jgi:hypothetical protein
MKTTRFALIAGVVYLVAGLLAFVPATLVPPPPDAPPTTFALFYGYFLGLFPVNALHSALHVVLGVWGIVAASREPRAVRYARALTVVFGALAVIGLLPGARTLFGVMPIHGNDVWLHAVTALLSFHFGWRVRAARNERRHSVRDRRQRAVPVARERRFGLADRREGFAM